MIFAREISDPLTRLVKTLDKQLAAIPRRKGEDKLGVFVVFCTDDPNMPKRLEKLIDDEGLKHVVLCTFAPSGPVRYRIAADASHTVLVYRADIVTANFALRKDELDEDTEEFILKAVKKVLPKK
ncbi:MAG: hypothetical protein L0241_25540 [Planctomycetia bacterium]|nr:hypothetical protein [Planctomycetia bacterium]